MTGGIFTSQGLAGGRPYSFNRTTFVDQVHGSDATGEPERPDRPFATILAAMQASGAPVALPSPSGLQWRNWQIVVRPGIYSGWTISQDNLSDLNFLWGAVVQGNITIGPGPTNDPLTNVIQTYIRGHLMHENGRLLVSGHNTAHLEGYAHFHVPDDDDTSGSLASVELQAEDAKVHLNYFRSRYPLKFTGDSSDIEIPCFVKEDYTGSPIDTGAIRWDAGAGITTAKMRIRNTKGTNRKIGETFFEVTTFGGTMRYLWLDGGNTFFTPGDGVGGATEGDWITTSGADYTLVHGGTTFVNKPTVISGTEFGDATLVRDIVPDEFMPWCSQGLFAPLS